MVRVLGHTTWGVWDTSREIATLRRGSIELTDGDDVRGYRFPICKTPVLYLLSEADRYENSNDLNR